MTNYYILKYIMYKYLVRKKNIPLNVQIMYSE